MRVERQSSSFHSRACHSAAWPIVAMQLLLNLIRAPGPPQKLPPPVQTISLLHQSFFWLTGFLPGFAARPRCERRSRQRSTAQSPLLALPAARLDRTCPFGIGPRPSDSNGEPQRIEEARSSPVAAED